MFSIRRKSHLIIKIPPGETSSDDFDLIAFYEKDDTCLKLGEMKPSRAYYFDLFGILHALSSYPDEGESIDSRHDLTITLKAVIP